MLLFIGKLPLNPNKVNVDKSFVDGVWAMRKLVGAFDPMMHQDMLICSLVVVLLEFNNIPSFLYHFFMLIYVMWWAPLGHLFFSI